MENETYSLGIAYIIDMYPENFSYTLLKVF